jgi:uncharacterized membrane protein
MDRPTKLIVDCSTGEQTVVELSDEEIAQLETDRQAAEAQRAEQEAAEQARTAKRLSAADKLRALGLDEAEVAALLG